MSKTFHGTRPVEAGTTHYLSATTYFGNRVHAYPAHIEGGGLLLPFCGVNSERCSRAHGQAVTCPGCLKAIREHQLQELLQPWPRCPRCWGHQTKSLLTPLPTAYCDLNRMLLRSVCSYCLGTGIHPEPGRPCPPLPVRQAGVAVSKAGLGYAQCDGCHNHRPIELFAAWQEGAYCGACASRCQREYKYYAPGQLAAWSARNLADVRRRHPQQQEAPPG